MLPFNYDNAMKNFQQRDKESRAVNRRKEAEKFDEAVLAVIFSVIIIAIVGLFYLVTVQEQKDMIAKGYPFVGDRIATQDFEGVVIKEYAMKSKTTYKVRLPDGRFTDVLYTDIQNVKRVK